MNKRMKNVYERYQQSTDYTLDSVYGKYSIYKTRAFEHCQYLMDKDKGFSLKIISHNVQFFTCGYEYIDEKGKRFFCYITPSSVRTCEIDF